MAAGSESAATPPPLAAEGIDRLRIDRSPRASRRRRRTGPWIVFAALVVAAAGGVYATMGKELFAPKVATARVERVPATEGAVRTTASGYVVARRRAAISSKLSGRLEELKVDVGDDVKTGQLLGRLGHADLDAAVLEAKSQVDVQSAQADTARDETRAERAAAAVAGARVAERDAAIHEMESRLADAERTLKREQELKPGVATTQEAIDRATMEREVAARRLDQMRAERETVMLQRDEAGIRAEVSNRRAAAAAANVSVAAAALQQAEATRADADIVAPFAGRVLRKEAELGEMVAPVNAAGGTTRGAIVTLADFQTLEMEVDVIERDIGLIETGAPCRIALDSRRDHPYAGIVRQIVPTADRTKSTVQVKVAFRALDDHVFPEMSGRVEFLKSGVSDAVLLGADKVFVPKAALVERAGRRGAFEIKEGKAAFHDVAEAAHPSERADAVEIASGFAGGEDVIVAPPERLADGDVVRVAEPAK